MFRRFMIVCWVLFGLSVAATTALYAAHYSAYQDFLQAVDERDAILERGTARARAEKETRAEVDGPWKDYAGDTVENGSTGDAPWEDDPIIADDEAKALDVLDLRIDSSMRVMESYTSDIGNAMSISALILLWNIIWHVGHWIWMGREER
jgi:hypothetical protein